LVENETTHFDIELKETEEKHGTIQAIGWKVTIAEEATFRLKE
jgi:hypothetical protein